MKEDIKVILFDIYGVVVEKSGELNDDVVNVLQKLKEKGIRLVLCSNSSRKILELWDSKYDFLKYFDDMILAESLQVTKPDPEIFREVIKKNSDVLPQNILFIDDNKLNILAGEAEGLIGLRFVNSKKLSSDLEKLGIL